MPDYTIVLADDHALVREGIRNLIQNEKGLRVIGEAADGIGLLKLLKRKQPDLVILDISMPGLRGTEAAYEIHKNYPQMRILMLSMHKSRTFLSMSLKAGAHGYLLKDDTGDELLRAISTLRQGRTFLSSRLSTELSSEIIDICRGKINEPPDVLTHRERQILKLIAEGHTDREISQMLYISLRTAQRHRLNIRAKLNIKHTAELVKYAIAKGYTDGYGSNVF